MIRSIRELERLVTQALRPYPGARPIRVRLPGVMVRHIRERLGLVERIPRGPVFPGRTDLNVRCDDSVEYVAIDVELTLRVKEAP